MHMHACMHARRFHNLRTKYPHLFSSQLANKLWYTRLGSEAYFFPNAPDIFIDSRVQVGR